MRILLVDDETLARDRLRRMLETTDEHEVVGEAANGLQAVTLCEECAPDLVLLDIRMPGMDGLEAARHFLELENPPAVIFCTAYEEHAIEAFDLQAVGYLLKPVRKDDLATALSKSVRLNRAQLAALDAADDGRCSHISARTHRGLELIAVGDVRFFQADQKYVTVYYSGGEIIVDETLRELETEFADVFIRVPGEEAVETVFATLDSMVSSLESGEMEDEHIDRINRALDHFSLQQTKLGSQMNRADLQREVNDKRLLLMDEDISNLEDADIAKLVTELQAKLVSRNAAQQTFIKIAQDNLFNYIR